MNTYSKSKPLILLMVIVILSSTTLVSQSAQAANYGTAHAPGLAGSGASPLAIVGAPPNDNFDNATIVTGLSFSDSVDMTEATLEPDEKLACSSSHTVWYSFTPSANSTVSVDLTGSNFWDTNITIYQAVDPGITGLFFLRCAFWSQTISFDVQAGSTYYIQVGAAEISNAGILQLKINQILAPANDDFANATIIQGIPYEDTVDTSAATTQLGEPWPTCAYWGFFKSVWYAFTPTTSGSFSALTPWTSVDRVVAVYTGTSLDSLTEVQCKSFVYNPLTIQLVGGTTYYFQVASLNSWQNGGFLQFQLDVPPPPNVGFFYYPWEPSTFDTIQFVDSSFDPALSGFKSYTWDFGDGTASTDPYAFHQYSADGDYTVQHSATTFDGRTASNTQVVQVRTHDVAITRIVAPLAASVGQTRPIVVSVRSTRYTETVRVDLYKAVPGGGYLLVGSQTQVVPAHQANRPTFYLSQYKFTNEDASVGKVSFKAIATIEYYRDAFLADNEVIALPSTKVNKSK